MRRLKRRLASLALGAVIAAAWPGRAGAFVFVDASALAKRLAPYVEFTPTFQHLLRGNVDVQHAFRSACAAAREWRGGGWMDTLEVVSLPWFDDVEGIDDARDLTSFTLMSVAGPTRL